MRQTTPQTTDIAIIGMGCIFPGSFHLKDFWHLLFTGTDAIKDIPDDTHWQITDYFDPDPLRPDHTYCTRGGFIPKISFDPAAFGIPPNNITATDTAQLLGLEVAKMALEDAGYAKDHPFLAQGRVNVILGVTGTQELVIPLGARLGHPIWKNALDAAGIPSEQKKQVLDTIRSSYAQWQENSFPGLLGNVVAGRIANRFNLSGTNSVSDAACASSLAALHTAVMELTAHKCDMSITGGVDCLNDIFMHMCFARTGVLSHTSDARPFSKDADGTVLGEGIGMLVLKRLADAQKNKDRIYAVIKGVGTASDGKTSAIYAPDAKGQRRALQDAYDQAGINPASVGLIEAHGTGTRVGDKVEFDALTSCFGAQKAKNVIAIGSVKSMIGHTKAAAGAAGIIKAALALHHKVILPTLKADTPDTDLDINNSAFYLNNRSKPWIPGSKNASPRRAGISAFGFGGSNFHAVLEEYDAKKNHVSWDGSVQIAAFSAPDTTSLLEKLKAFETQIIPDPGMDDGEISRRIALQASVSRQSFSADQKVRLLMVLHKDNDPGTLLDQARAVVQKQGPSRDSVYYGTGPAKGKLGFLFPGQGSQYPHMGKDLFAVFPEAMEALALAQKIFKEHTSDTLTPKQAHQELTDFIFALPGHVQDKSVSESQLRHTRVAQMAIGAVSLAMTLVLRRFGILPHQACGHSFGELCALHAAGWIDDSTLLTLAAVRGKHMTDAGRTGSDSGSMLAVQADLPDIEALLSDLDLDLVLANRNSPNQGVVSGPTPDIEKAAKACRKKKIRAVKLPVAAAFHSHLVADAASPFNAFVADQAIVPTDIQVLSNTTGKPYESDSVKIRSILGHQLMHPVRFMENIETMHENGVSLFVEAGPKTVLTGLVNRILDSDAVTAVGMDASCGKKSGLTDLARVLCTVAAKGFCVDFTRWEDPIKELEPKRMRVQLSGANPKPVPIKAPAPEKITAPEKKQVSTKNTHDNPAPVSQQVRPDTSGTGQQGYDMHTPSDMYHSAPQNAMHLVQKGLEAMQTLQAQTARTHEKFLETQALASHNLAAIMEQTRLFMAAPGTGPADPALNALPDFPSPSRDRQQMASPPAPPNRVNGETPQQMTHTPYVQTGADASCMPDRSGEAAGPRHGAGMKDFGFYDPDAGGSAFPAEQTQYGHGQISDASQTAHDVQPDVGHSDTALPAHANPSKSDLPDIQSVLFDTVSRLTGFPEEMLELSMDIESDLGIDSIKKVEIISELEKHLPDTSGLTTESIGSVRTLTDICQAIAAREPAPETEPHFACRAAQEPGPGAAPGACVLQTPKITKMLVDTISELTGFPEEMLEPGLNLESDLGIDSIKRVEILSRLEQALGDGANSLSAEAMAKLKTIQDIVDFLEQNEPETQGSVKKKPFLREKKPEDTKPPDLIRREIALPPYPIHQIRFFNGSRIQIPAGKKIYITRDQPGISGLLKKEFENQGLTADVIDISAGTIPELPDAAGIVIVQNKWDKPLDTWGSSDTQDATDFVKSAFALARKNAAHLQTSARQKGAFFTTISFSGGRFGFGDTAFATHPVYGALAGLAKTAHLEWQDVLCHALDMPCDMNACKTFAEPATALIMTNGSVEMGLAGDNCMIPTMKDAPVKKGKTSLTSKDVVVISGGAKGVTAACAVALAESCSPAIALVGRSPVPMEEPEWAQNITDPARLKKAILTREFAGKKPRPADIEKRYQSICGNRRILHTMEQIRSYGAKVDYWSADIRDTRALSKTLDDIRLKLGPVTAVIHGAGVLEDKLIAEKKSEQFNRVFDTKVAGLHALVDATKKDALKYMIVFSSIAARTGNPGQCDYAMANEVLNKTTGLLAKKHPDCRYLAINWGPWDGGMVHAGLKREFAKKGMGLIPLEAGCRQLILEMENPDPGPVEIVITAPGQPQKKKKVPVLSRVTELAVSRDNMPVLDSHRINNEPVVPFALLAEMMAQAAEKNNPGLVFAGINDMRLLKGIRPKDSRVNLAVNLGKCTPADTGFIALSSLTSVGDIGQIYTHATAAVILKNSLPEPPVVTDWGRMELAPGKISAQKAYETILFHGSALQAIDAITGISDKGIAVTASPAPAPELWFKTPLQKHWVTDPLLLDAAFQAAIIWTWETRGQACLPACFANLRIYASFHRPKHSANNGNKPARNSCSKESHPDDKRIHILFTVNENTEHSIKGYFTFLDADNTVVASITGFEAIVDPALHEKFKPGPLFDRPAILEFAQGNPSAAFGDKYKVFDKDRQIARLPGPPYFFMDRVLTADHAPWVMQPGGWIETQYDIPQDAWYFTANRTHTMPFCILLEIALQPCGWLAAYAGSALHSDARLYFRNLGGKAVLQANLTKDSGTLTIRTRMTDVSTAGGMIIQNFALQVLNKGEMVYQGTTNFGFFTARSLADQKGIRNSKLVTGNNSSRQDKTNFLQSKTSSPQEKTFANHCPNTGDFPDPEMAAAPCPNLKTAAGFSPEAVMVFEDDAPLTPDDPGTSKDTGMPAKALRMIDTIDVIDLDGGRFNKGYVQAAKKNDPDEWFFDAHFYQDPVCPGSLGIESFLQTMRCFLQKKYDIDPVNYTPELMSGQNHEWIYRGQIIPASKQIIVHTHIRQTAAGNDDRYEIVADGALTVDGICIYEMKYFGLAFVPVP